MKTRVWLRNGLTCWLKLAGLVMGLLAGLFFAVNVQADGCFVLPPFVWNKHKDINEPTQKAIIFYDEGHEDLMLQVKYNGPVQQFGWLVPVPGLPTVKPGSMECFYELSRYTQENWEPRIPVASSSRDFGFGTLNAAAEPYKPEPVKVVEIKTVGAYDVAVLSASDPGTLETWLEGNGFAYPREKAEVIDDYVQKHWYFVAIKIDLTRADSFKIATSPRQSTPGRGVRRTLPRVSEKLSTGELQPLQIGFASGQCVFPLKISSVNGTPSEVQVYVLSPEPLVERRMFEKKFPEVHRQSVKAYDQQVQWWQDNQKRMQVTQQHFHSNAVPWRMPWIQQPMEATTNIPDEMMWRQSVPADLLLHYAAIGARDLPACGRQIPGFQSKTWWLTKQTWTFKPKEMQDLVFQPAAQVFLEDLAGEEEYYALQNLERLGPAAVPALMQALASTNARVRLRASGALDGMIDGGSPARDPRVAAALPALFRDPDPLIREAGANGAAWNWRREFAGPVAALLQDENPRVQQAAVLALNRADQGREDFLPAVEKLLASPDVKMRVNALEVLAVGRGTVPVPKEVVLPLLSDEDPFVLRLTVRLLERGDYEFTYGELTPILRNKLPLARMLGVELFRELNNKESIGAIIPLLRDPEPDVRDGAWDLLKHLTGQEIPEEQPDQWEQWWAANKATVLIADYSESLALDSANGELYRMRACMEYDAHQFGQALADFRKASQLGTGFPEYLRFRIWLLRARAGDQAAATKELMAYLASRTTGRPDDWPSKVGRFLTGQLTEAAFINAAQNPNPQTDREQHCEAWFYAGSKRLIAGDKTTATDDFQKCLATGVKNFEEYGSAGAELKLLQGPAEASRGAGPN